MDVNSYFKTWSEKLGIPDEEIKRDYDKIYKDEQSRHKDLGEEENQKRALQRVMSVLKKQLRSPAVGFEGMILAVGDLVDTVRSQKEFARKSFEENPQQAIDDGLTDDKGTPLDNRAEFSTGRINPNYTKPLPVHNYLRNVWGVALKSGKDSEPRFFSLLLSASVAENENIPIFKPVRFRAIDKSDPELPEKDSQYTLNSSTFTKFEFDGSLKLPDVEKIIEQYMSDFKIDIGGLDKYHNDNQDNYQRLAVVEADVGMLNLDVPPTRNSRVMILEDESDLEDIEAKGVMCWVPMRINIDFAEQSKVIVIGKTGRGKKRNDDGTLSDEPGDVTLNVYGLYAIPKYRIEPESLPQSVPEPKESSEVVNENNQDW